MRVDELSPAPGATKALVGLRESAIAGVGPGPVVPRELLQPAHTVAATSTRTALRRPTLPLVMNAPWG